MDVPCVSPNLPLVSNFWVRLLPSDCGWALTGCALIPLPICFIHAIYESPHSGLMNVSRAATSREVSGSFVI